MWEETNKIRLEMAKIVEETRQDKARLQMAKIAEETRQDKIRNGEYCGGVENQICSSCYREMVFRIGYRV